MAALAGDSPHSTSYGVGTPRTGVRPMPLVAFPCGSPSTSSVRCSAAARLAARLTAVVVLPTPPFWFATAMIRATESLSGRQKSLHGLEQRSRWYGPIEE